MGLSIWLDRALVRADERIVQMVATDDEAEEEFAPAPAAAAP